MTTTTGTNTALIWSTRFLHRRLAAWADCTRATMRDSVDAAPTAPVFTTSSPLPLTEPPITRLPACLAWGRLSPVSKASSVSLSPASTTPSTAMRSPGRTTTRSPGRTALQRQLDFLVPRRTRAVAGSACSARMASPSAAWHAPPAT